MSDFSNDLSRQITVECVEHLGEWSARIVAITRTPDGFEGEPWTITLHFHTLDLVGPEWWTECVLDEVTRRLSMMNRAGYE